VQYVCVVGRLFGLGRPADGRCRFSKFSNSIVTFHTEEGEEVSCRPGSEATLSRFIARTVIQRVCIMCVSRFSECLVLDRLWYYGLKYGTNSISNFHTF
jgi:hypothetical protein